MPNRIVVDEQFADRDDLGYWESWARVVGGCDGDVVKEEEGGEVCVGHPTTTIQGPDGWIGWGLEREGCVVLKTGVRPGFQGGKSDSSRNKRAPRQREWDGWGGSPGQSSIQTVSEKVQ